MSSIAGTSELPRILVFSRFFPPGIKGGGPVRSVSSIVARLSDRFEFHVVTLDRDLGDGRPYPDLPTDEWLSRDDARVMYMTSQATNYRKIRRIISEAQADLVYLNSFFDPLFTLLPLWALRKLGANAPPVLLAPRGEFSPGALKIRYWKKRPYTQLLRKTGLLKTINWHASSSIEAQQIAAALELEFDREDSRVFEAANLAASLPSVGDAHKLRRRKVKGPLRLCVLSRVAPMKNLDFSLQVLADVKSDVMLDIYGNIEDAAYWDKCKALIRALPNHISVKLVGPLARSEIAATLVQYDVFFFPTRGENFGHVIYEALQCGLPVLTSDQTPWGLLEDTGAGKIISLDSQQQWVSAVEEMANWSVEQFDESSGNARALAETIEHESDAILANIAMFDKVTQTQVAR